MRINQYIARSGVTSRRKAEELIKAGQVTQNGIVVTELGTEVSEKDIVTVNGKEIKPQEHKYYMLNKPNLYTTTKDDPYALHTIMELLPEDPSLFPVGRLDRETTGLIIITNDGDFGQRMIHPSQKIEKEYIVRTKMPITDDQIVMLKEGLELEDGIAKPKSITQMGKNEISLVIEMGRKRVVRRMVAAIGNKVTSLTRVRIGKLTLDVAPGRYRELTPEEVAYFD
jgi:23S rRNA pseudouridine2605 synthase